MNKHSNGNFKLDRSEWFKLVGMMLTVIGTFGAAMLGVYVEVKQLQTTVEVKFENADKRLDGLGQDIRELRGKH